MTARVWASGAFAALSAVATGLAAMALVIPGTHLLGPLARILDGVAPHLFALGLALALVAVLLGSRVIGGALALLAGAGGAVLFMAWQEVTVPLAKGAPELSVLFFNTRGDDNPTPADRIVAAAMETGADVLVFAEAEVVAGEAEALAARYDFVSPCPADACELLVVSRLPVVRFWRLSFNRAWGPRYAVLEVERPEGGTLFVSAVHLTKPWFSGMAEAEIAQLSAQYRWFDGRPVIAVGDYNTPAWSEPLRGLLRQTGVRALRSQPPSWPAAGSLGLPIDQAMVANGAGVTGIDRFGEELGSNHSGFVAGVVVASP